MSRKRGGARASELLKTMGRGSPRSQEVPAQAPTQVPAPEPEETTGEDGGAQDHRSSPSQASRERPAKPVRITVDLDAERHRFLKEYAFRQDAKGTAVVRALLDELRADEDLAARVRGRLAGR